MHLLAKKNFFYSEGKTVRTRLGIEPRFPDFWSGLLITTHLFLQERPIHIQVSVESHYDDNAFSHAPSSPFMDSLLWCIDVEVSLNHSLSKVYFFLNSALQPWGNWALLLHGKCHGMPHRILACWPQRSCDNISSLVMIHCWVSLPLLSVITLAWTSFPPSVCQSVQFVWTFFGFFMLFFTC